MATWTTRSMLFNGSTQYATGGNVLGFEYTDPFSISSWFKTTDATQQTIVGKFLSTGILLDIVPIATVEGFLSFSLWVDAGNRLTVDTATSGYNDGAWHHCVLSYDGSATGAGTFFVMDGVLDAGVTWAEPVTSSISNSGNFVLGARSDASQPFEGGLDEVAVYNKALSLAEAQWIRNGGWANDLLSANAPSNLVSWWRMGEGVVGGLMLDEVGPNNLTLVDSPTVQVDAPEGAGYDTRYLNDIARYSYLGIGVQSLLYRPYGGGGGGIVKKYKMRAVDSGNELQPAYITWVSSGSPDFSGAGFSGGTPTPIGSMVLGSATVVAEWEE